MLLYWAIFSCVIPLFFCNILWPFSHVWFLIFLCNIPGQFSRVQSQYSYYNILWQFSHVWSQYCCVIFLGKQISGVIYACSVCQIFQLMLTVGSNMIFAFKILHFFFLKKLSNNAFRGKKCYINWIWFFWRNQ